MINVRQAKPDDIVEIMRVEESWPEHERASRALMMERLEKFPVGFIVGEVDNKIVATLTSCLMHYDPLAPDHLKNWDVVTNYGHLPDEGAIDNPNALYLVSAVIDKDMQGKQLYPSMVNAIVGVAKSLGVQYIVAGAVIPGYDAYCREHGNIDAREYVFMKKDDGFVDRFIDIYRKLDFYVPDRNHVIENYYPDEASRHYAAIVVHKLYN